jgi:hypothetical protein
MKINKFKFGFILLGIILFIFLIGILYLTMGRDLKFEYNKIVNDAHFIELNEKIIKFDGLDNIAILPIANFVVINGFVIDKQSKTYGKEPVLGFYESYYEDATENKFENFEELLRQINGNFTESNVNYIFSGMRKFDFVDIKRIKDDNGKVQIVYRNKVSAMWGEEGIIYSEFINEENINASAKIEKIKNNFYHFIGD